MRSTCRARGKRDSFCTVAGCRECRPWSTCRRYRPASSRSTTNTREPDVYRMMSVYLASGTVAVHVRSSSVHRHITDQSVVRWLALYPLTQALTAPATHGCTHQENCNYTQSHIVLGPTDSHMSTCRGSATCRIQHKTTRHVLSLDPTGQGVMSTHRSQPTAGSESDPGASPGHLRCSPGSTVSQADW